MPIYESPEYSQDTLFELRKKNRCKQCGGMLNVFMDFDQHKAYLACNSDQSHEGIEREAEPLFEPNIPTRREEMVEQLGEQKATALAKYEGVVSLSRVEAMEILETIWPDAPEIEVKKAAIICHQYGLNPLMRHIFLIPFKKRNKKGEVIGEEWATVQGISSNRLIARRHHNYSYLDLTPRRMTEEEQTKINGEVDNSRVWAITKLKDIDTGAEAPGVGSWPADEEPYGKEKGNTKLNMACIRSEREALERLYPADMPHGIEVIEEKYVDGKYQIAEPSKTEVDETTMPGVEEGRTKTGVGVSSTEEKQPIASGAPAPPGVTLPKNPVFKSWGELAEAARQLKVMPSDVFKRSGYKKWEDFPTFRDAWVVVEEIVIERAQSPKML